MMVMNSISVAFSFCVYGSARRQTRHTKLHQEPDVVLLMGLNFPSWGREERREDGEARERFLYLKPRLGIFSGCGERMCREVAFALSVVMVTVIIIVIAPSSRFSTHLTRRLALAL